MVYQRTIPDEELFSAQLELLMQNARGVTLMANTAGIVAAFFLLQPYFNISVLLMCCTLGLAMLVVRTLHMSQALHTRAFITSPRRVFWRLIFGAVTSGAAWAAAYIYAAKWLPVEVQYVCLLLLCMIVAASVGATVVIREYFAAFLFASIWPVAWWTLAQYQEQPYNLVVGGLLLFVCALFLSIADRIYQSYHNMIATNWAREAIALELSELTGSLRDRNRQLREARRQLTDLANVDELTGLGNRRLINKVLLDEINRARRAGSVISIILLDVDFFKKYNDTYGHPAGDEVLQKLADLMRRAATRAGEVVGRYGGEEFIIVMPGASADTALRTAIRLKQAVVAEAIPHEGSEIASHITISQGVVTVAPEGNVESAELIKMADNALYRAKGSGRNSIIVA